MDEYQQSILDALGAIQSALASLGGSSGSDFDDTEILELLQGVQASLDLLLACAVVGIACVGVLVGFHVLRYVVGGFLRDL